MVSSELKPLLKSALVLGALSGALEILWHAEGRLGMGMAEMSRWIAIAVVLGWVVTFPAAIVAGFLRSRWGFERGVGLIAGALFALHSALAIRFNWVLNEPIASPKVWLPLGAVGLLSLGVGLLLDGMLRRGARVQWGVVVLACLAAFWKGKPPSSIESTDQVNVLFVTFDTTRADRLGAYGGRAVTPAIDSLAADGVLFEQAIAPAPLTEASHLALLTGKPLHQTGIYANGTRLGERPDLLSHAFQQAGYRTGAVVSGFPLHAKYGWAQGFDRYEDDFGATPGLHRLSLVRAWDQFTLPGNTLRERPGDLARDRALEFLEDYSDGPFFLWVHFFDPHAPYEVDDDALAAAPRDGEPLDLPRYWPPPHRSITSVEWLIDAYEKEISKTDAYLGALLDALPQDVRDRTVVAFTADHGESLTEHDYLFDHGDYLYDASLHIPLILSGPGLPSGERVSCQVSGIDVAPTLRELTSLPPLAQRAGQGRSLVGIDDNCTPLPAHAAAVAERYVDDPAVDHALRLPLEFSLPQLANEAEGEVEVEATKENRMAKFILHGRGGETLFDLLNDPGETVNQAEEAPEAAASAREILNVVIEGAVGLSLPESDASTLDALKALGYVE